MNKTTKIILGIVVLVIIVVLVAVFYKPVPKEAIKIGVIGPLTGDAAVYGESITSGINLALEEINSQGGINGRKVELIIEDHQCGPAPAVTAINKLINIDKVSIVIDEGCSSAFLAEAPVAETNKVLLLGATASNPKIKYAGDYVFRIYISDDYYGKAVAQFLSKKGYKNAAVLYSNSAWATGLMEVFKEEFPKLDGVVVSTESIEDGKTDFKTQLIKIKEKNPQVIFAPAYYKELVVVAKQVKELGINSQFVSAEPVEAFIEASKEAGEGFIFAQSKQNVDQYYQEFKAKYNKKYGKEPTGYAIDYGYDILKILVKPLVKCGEDIECVKKELYKIHDYHGASGLINFDEYGELMEKEFSYQQVKNSQFVPYED